MGLFALLDVAASLDALLEGDVLAGTLQQHLIQQGIRFAGGVVDSLARIYPGFLSGDDALLHLGNDPVGDGCVNVHGFAPFVLRGSRDLW